MSVRRLAPPEQQPKSFAFSADNLAWAKKQVAKYPEGRQQSAIIPLLWRAQEQAGGWLPEAAIRYVSEFLGMAHIRALEVATFYTMFNLTPVGKFHVQLCGTTPCRLRGADDLEKVCRKHIGGQMEVTAPFTVDKDAGQILNVTLKAHQTGPQDIAFQYTLNADKDVPLTMFIAGLSTNADFRQGQAIFKSAEGQTKTLPLAFGRNSSDWPVAEIDLQSADAGEYKLGIDPPTAIGTDGQARILLGDLHAYQAQLCREAGHDVDDRTAAQLWVMEVATPTMQRAHAAVGATGTPIQAYCDLLEVRWLLSERAGHDVGTERALQALARNVVPAESAAQLVVVEDPTEPFSVLDDVDDA